MKKLSAIVACVAALAATGCATDEGSRAAPAAPATSVPAGPSPAAPGTAAADAEAPGPAAAADAPVPPGPVALAVREAAVGGRRAWIVTVNGMTAYRFEADEDRPSKVNCLYDCLTTWPPVLTDGSRIQLTGIERELVGTVERPDGLRQVTLGGWPLYRFREDETGADTLGEGVGGNWSTVLANGKPAVKKTGRL